MNFSISKYLELKRLFFSCFTICMVLANLLIASDLLAFDTRAKNAILYDMQTDTILYSKNQDKRIAPASMTKILTSYVVFSQLKDGTINFDDRFLVSKKAWKAEGSRMFLEVDKYTSVDDLLLGLIVQSGNDAAITLAEGSAGSEEVFAQHMTKQAINMGSQNSNFTNASGLPNPNHYSTAYDLLLITKNLITDFPQLYQIFAKNEFSYNDINQKNRNLLLTAFEGADGVKTGYTAKSGYSAVVSVLRNGRRLILVLAGLGSVQERNHELKRMLEWGFFNWRNIKVVNLGQKIADMPLALANQTTITAISNQDLFMSVPAVRQKETEYVIEYNSPIIAPVKKGEVIAELKITNSNMTSKVDLIANESIEEVGVFGNIIAHFSSLFKDYAY